MKKGSTEDGLVYHAGFPNAGEDQHGQSLSIDSLVVRHRASTYFWRLEHDVPGLGWKADSLVVVDRAMPPKPGKLCVLVVHDDFIIGRIKDKQFKDLEGNILDESTQLWGMITFCLQRYD